MTTSASDIPPSRPSRRWLEPLAVAALVAATRIPLFTRTFYSNDAIGDALATRGFDFAHGVPHLPGGVLHIGVGKLLGALAGDLNTGFLFESLLLSIGATLFLWWTVRRLTTPSIARAATFVWIVNPFFWFAGITATAYPHEAFFACAIAALAVAILTAPPGARRVDAQLCALAATLALAGAARPTAMIFLAPCVAYVFLRARPRRRTWLVAAALAATIVAAWLSLLFLFAGGARAYIGLLQRAGQLANNSMLLRGTWGAHAAMLEKFLLYAVVGTAPFLALVMASLVRRARAHPRMPRAVRDALWILATPGLLFFVLIFYENVGYLLPLFALATIGAASELHNRGVRLRWWAGAWGAVWIVFFLAPMPGVTTAAMFEQHAIASNFAQTANRYPAPAERLRAVAIKLAMNGTAAGARADDSAHRALLDALAAQPSPENGQTVLTTRWGYWPAYYRPQCTVYELFVSSDSMARTVRRWHERRAADIGDSVVAVPASQQVFLVIWPGHWMFPDIARQVHLAPIPMPPFLETYRIVDEHFHLRINGTTFQR